MINTKLIKLLRTFSKKEKVQFRDFVNSPCFNKNKNIMMLGEEVLRFYPDFDSKDFTKECLYMKIFHKGEIDYSRINNLISDLYQLAVSFLKISVIEEKEYENEIDLLNELHERQLDAIYSQREKKIRSYLNNSFTKDEAYYYLRYNFAKINTSHYQFQENGNSINQIQEEFNAFLDYSLIGLLRLYSKMLHNKHHGEINFNMEMFESLWEFVRDKDFEGNSSCQIYKQIILLELTRDEKEYRKLLSLKEKHNENIPKEDMYYILLIVNSFAVYKLKLGDESYHKDRFNALREILERDNISANNFLHLNFISTFTSACMAGEYEWAEDFMNRCQNDISPDEEKGNSVNYCKGFLAYRMKGFDKALEYFSQTNFRFYLLKVMVKSYSIRIYYEQNLFEQVLSAIDAFRHYLKSEKLIAEEQKTAHFEFLKYLTRLAEFKIEGISKNNANDLTMLEDQIVKMSANPLGAKNWLIEKVSELK